MKELKARTAQSIAQEEEMLELGAPDGIEPELVYLKSEADKVIADLEESHKMEVKQLLIEIKRLENLCASYRHDCDNLAIREANALKEIGRDNRVIRHQKYKRCLAMASYWVAVSYQCVDDKHRQNAERHHRKWLELANKFEEIK